MFNGYPTEVVLRFGEVVKQASDISTSTDATTATTFTFPSPVFVQANTEYAFVALCNNDDYTMYTARMGQTTLDASRLISKNPYLSSMFKSQNGGTWTAEQNEDVKFKIKRASFTENTEGNIYLVNDEIPAFELDQNPFEVDATAGSGTTFGSTPALVKVKARNHEKYIKSLIRSITYE